MADEAGGCGHARTQVGPVRIFESGVGEDGFGISDDVEDLLQRCLEIGKGGVGVTSRVKAFSDAHGRAMDLKGRRGRFTAEEAEVVAVAGEGELVEHAGSIDGDGPVSSIHDVVGGAGQAPGHHPQGASDHADQRRAQHHVAMQARAEHDVVKAAGAIKAFDGQSLLRRQRRETTRGVARPKEGRWASQNRPQPAFVVFATDALGDDRVEGVLQSYAVGGVGSFLGVGKCPTAPFKGAQQLLGEHAPHRREELLKFDDAVINETAAQAARRDGLAHPQLTVGGGGDEPSFQELLFGPVGSQRRREADGLAILEMDASAPVVVGTQFDFSGDPL